MADTKLTGLASFTPILTDYAYGVDDPGGTPVSGRFTLSSLQTLFAANISLDTARITSGTFADARVAESNVTQHEAAITITESQISDFGTYLTSFDVVDDTTPQLGGSLDVNGNKIVSTSNGNIDIEPHGTGNVLLGNFTFNADQTVGAGQDNYALVYDNSGGLIGLEELTTSLITSGTFADARISESSVTQHEAALSITESQISDLGSYDGWGDVVDADIIPDADGTRDLGSTGTRFAEVYTDALAVTNNITVGGTVDGRDLATDGTKLDGIETSADVTDTANVTAAGALMDSEVTNLAQVKAFDTTDYATAAQGATADSALQDVVDDTTPQLGGMLDVNGNAIGDGTRELLTFTEDASAVNQINIENQATGSGPIVAAAGDDTNIDLVLNPKGSGDVILGNYVLDADATIGAGQDDYVLTYDNASGTWRPEAAAGGSGGDAWSDPVDSTITLDADSTYDLAETGTRFANAYFDAIDVGANIVVGGTVDGRDVAADGSKLDGVEALADVTDTANVTSAGALMDSELASIADVKALDQSVISGASPTFGTGNMTDATNKRFMTDAQETVLDNTSGTNTGDEAAASTTVAGVVELATIAEVDTGTDATRAITPDALEGSALQSKVDGIEAGADVTDTANVTAAGALMDSEVTNLAQVKAFDTTDYATAAQGTTADSALQDVVDDTTPQLGGSLDVAGNKIVSTSNGDIDIEPNGTGNVILGNYVIDADATIGASQDDYVLTYDNTSGTWGPEAAAGAGGGDAWSDPIDSDITTTDSTYDIGTDAARMAEIYADDFYATTSVQFGQASPDTVLLREAANILAMRNGANAQGFKAYNFYTDASNWESADFLWDTNVFYIGTDDAGTGVNRDVVIKRGGDDRITITSTEIEFSERLKCTTPEDIGSSADPWATFYTEEDIVFDERADHAQTPAAGKGQLWVRSDTPNVLIYTDDAGTDHDLTAGGGGASAGKNNYWIDAGAMLSRVTNGPAYGSEELATNDIQVDYWDFDASTEEGAQFKMRMPEGWDEGTVTARFVWSHDGGSSYGVVWSIAGMSLSDSGAIDTAMGTAVTVTDTGATTDDVYISDETSAVTIAGSPAAGDVCWFEVKRVAANGSDTLDVDARLLGVSLYFTRDSLTD